MFVGWRSPLLGRWGLPAQVELLHVPCGYRAGDGKQTVYPEGHQNTLSAPQAGLSVRIPIWVRAKSAPPIHRYSGEVMEQNHIHLGDASEFLRSLPAECADLIVADPPY